MTRLARAVAVVALAGLVAGCGSGGPDRDEDQPPPAGAAAPTTPARPPGAGVRPGNGLPVERACPTPT